jgi:hypothetical protein
MTTSGVNKYITNYQLLFKQKKSKNMGQNQNDNRNQKPGSASPQQSQEGNKKTTDPNNPIADKGTQQGSQSGDQQRSGSQSGNQPGKGSSQGRTDKDVQDVEELDETTTDEETTGVKRNRDSGSKSEERGSGNQNAQKGNK